MVYTCQYLPTAQANEEVFRNVLRHMRGDKPDQARYMYVPLDLDVTSPLPELFAKYSTGERFQKFTITNFEKITTDQVEISFEDIGIMSGGGYTLRYQLLPNNEVRFIEVSNVIMS